MMDVRHDALTHEHDPLPKEVAHLAQTDADGKEMEDKFNLSDDVMAEVRQWAQEYSKAGGPRIVDYPALLDL